MQIICEYVLFQEWQSKWWHQKKNEGKKFRVYRSGKVNSNMVNSKFHLIQSYYEIFFYHSPNISCLKCTVNFHLIRSKTLLSNDFELTVPNLNPHSASESSNAGLWWRFGMGICDFQASPWTSIAWLWHCWKERKQVILPSSVYICR